MYISTKKVNKPPSLWRACRNKQEVFSMSKNAKKRRKIENVADANSFTDETWSKFPNFLLTNPRFAGKKLSNDAKVLYLLMRNAFANSVKNGLKDENGIYFLFTQEKMVELLGRTRPTCWRAKNELKEAGLIDDTSDDDNNFNAKTGKKEPIRFYLLNIDYAINDTFNRVKNFNMVKTTEEKNKDAENSANSTNPKTDKNSQAPQPYGDHRAKNFNMDKNEDENVRSLDTTASLEENENSQAPQPYGDHRAKNFNMDKEGGAGTESADKSTFAENENFKKVPSALENRPCKKFLHNKDRYIDNLSNIYNKDIHFNTPLTTLDNIKDIKDSTLTDKLNQDIPSTIQASNRYNILSRSDLSLIANWLNDLNATNDMVNSVNYAIFQAKKDAKATDKQFFDDNQTRILAEVSGVLKWSINQINSPKSQKIRSPKDFIFANVKRKVTDLLAHHDKLDHPTFYQNKRVEKGTDWSKKHVDTNSNMTTEQLRELFKDLKNK